MCVLTGGIVASSLLRHKVIRVCNRLHYFRPTSRTEFLLLHSCAVIFSQNNKTRARAEKTMNNKSQKVKRIKKLWLCVGWPEREKEGELCNQHFGGDCCKNTQRA